MITPRIYNQDYGWELKKNFEYTYLTADSDIIKKFIVDEHSPLFYNLNDDGIIRFEWFLDEEKKTGTLIEKFENSNVWEELGNKILGSTINLKFRELFKVEKLTVLGDINETFKTKIQAMNPVIKKYIGGIN